MTSQKIVSIADGFLAVSSMLDEQQTRADMEGAMFTAIAMTMQLAEQVRSHPSWIMATPEARNQFESLIRVSF